MLLTVGKFLKTEVESVEEAVEAFNTLRSAGPYDDGSGFGASEMPDGLIYLHAGGKVCAKPFAKISYNGRVWDLPA